jgi:hypothetical protein
VLKKIDKDERRGGIYIYMILIYMWTGIDRGMMSREQDGSRRTK